MKEAAGASKSSLNLPVQGIIRFGNFEVDTRAGEVRRGGIKLKLNTTVSPDDRYLAATKVDGRKLMIFDTDSQKWAEVAQVSVSAITWSRDSNYVYFDTQPSAEPAIYRLRVSDHKLETVASLKNLRRKVLPSGTWMGLTPEGDPLLMRDTGTPEVYALDFEEP